MSVCTSFSSTLRPMRRLTAKMVFYALVTACRLAGAPTSTSPSSAYATIEGVVRAPSEFSITFGCPPSMMATQLFVVPRSMPMILAILNFLRYSENEVVCCAKWGFRGANQSDRRAAAGEKAGPSVIGRLALHARRFRDRHERRAQRAVVDQVA